MLKRLMWLFLLCVLVALGLSLMVTAGDEVPPRRLLPMAIQRAPEALVQEKPLDTTGLFAPVRSRLFVCVVLVSLLAPNVFVRQFVPHKRLRYYAFELSAVPD